jgi:hypothetical protein
MSTQAGGPRSPTDKGTTVQDLLATFLDRPKLPTSTYHGTPATPLHPAAPPRHLARPIASPPSAAVPPLLFGSSPSGQSIWSAVPDEGDLRIQRGRSVSSPIRQEPAIASWLATPIQHSASASHAHFSAFAPPAHYAFGGPPVHQHHGPHPQFGDFASPNGAAAPRDSSGFYQSSTYAMGAGAPRGGLPPLESRSVHVPTGSGYVGSASDPYENSRSAYQPMPLAHGWSIAG